MVKYGWMTSCVVHLELLTDMFVSSLLAYIAVKRMPDKIKLCKWKIKLNLFWVTFDTTYVWHMGSVALWVLEVLLSSLLTHSSSPTGGSVQGEERGVPYCHHRLIQTVKWFCSVLWKGGSGGGLKRLEGRQRILLLIYRSFSSFLCPLIPLPCCFVSTGWAGVTGSCPPPGHYSPDTSRQGVWCPPESHPHALQKWSC